jgi:hypothetical protein
MKKILALLIATTSCASLMSMDQEKEVTPVTNATHTSSSDNSHQLPPEDPVIIAALKARRERMINDYEHVQLQPDRVPPAPTAPTSTNQ